MPAPSKNCREHCQRQYRQPHRRRHLLLLAACANLLVGKVALSAEGDDNGVFCPSSSRVPSSIDGGREQWSGAVAIENKIYAIPHASTAVLIYDLASHLTTGSETIPSSLTSGEDSGDNWNGGVGLNNIVYGMPCKSKHVLVYNPASNKVTGSEKVPTTIDSGGCNWYGGVVLGNKVYGVPLDSDYVLKYDPSTNKVTGSEKIPTDLLGTGKSGGGAAYNEKLYMVPLDSNHILIYDPSTNKVEGSSQNTNAFLGAKRLHKWQGAVEINGKIYGIPSNANVVLIYDPSEDVLTASETIDKKIDIGDMQWSGGFEHNGKVYGTPYNSKHVLVYDPLMNSVAGSAMIPSSLDRVDAQWHGGVSVHGAVYSIPWDSNYVLIYEPPEPKGTFSYSGLPSDIDTGTGQWMGGVAAQGKVIGIPQNSDFVLIYDPVTNKVSGSERIPKELSPPGSVGNWNGAVELDGKVYGVPSGSDYVLIFDPVTEKASASEKIPDTIDGGQGQWASGVAMGGLVYGIPSNSDYVLVYNPKSGKATGSQKIPSDIDSGNKQWFGGVAYDDKVFGIPRDANKILIYDPSTNKVTGSGLVPTISQGGIDSGKAQWFGGVELDGKIYGIPSDSDYILIYDPATNVIDGAPVPKAIDSGKTQWRDGVVLNGKVYGIPFMAQYVLVYDPFTNAVTGTEKMPSVVDKGDKQWTGGVVLNERIYGIPTDSNYMLIYDPPVSTGSFSATSKVPTTSGVDGKQQQWRGSVALNSKIYSIPHNSNYVLIYDTYSDAITTSQTVPGKIDSGSEQWSGGVTLGKKIFGIPYNSDYILVLDTEKNEDLKVTYSKIIPSAIDTGGGQWQGGVAVQNTLYGIPYNSDYVLIYDTEADTVTGSDKIPASIDGGLGQWHGGAVFENKVYGVPCNANRVLIYDISNKRVEGSDPIPTYMINDDGEMQWAGAVLLGGIIYGVPAKSSFLLIFDPSTNVVSGSKVPCTLDGADSGFKWFGGLAAGNKVFGFPYDSNRIFVYDPETKNIAISETVSSTDANKGAALWAGGVTLDGTMYGAPSNADHMLIYKPVSGGFSTTTTFTTTSVSTTTSVTTTSSTSTTTSVTSTTSTVTSSTSTLTSTTTTTTGTFVNFGEECISDGQCASGSCRRRCCSVKAAAVAADVCSSCSSGSNDLSVDRGACYTNLAMADGWTWGDEDTDDGWKEVFDKDQEAILRGPRPGFKKALLNFKGDADNVRFMLRWGPTALPLPQIDHANPPLGLERSGEGLDPGLFDVDPKTGTISAKPKRNGPYSMYLVAKDGAGTAARLGLPAEFDQVVLKRWDFKVVGKPDFEVVSYNRVQPKDLAKGSDNDAPYAAATKIGSLNCTVGTTYRIAPVNLGGFVYKFAAGSGRVRFTIRNPPPNFFINPETGEIQGKPQNADIGRTIRSTLLVTDEGGGEAELEAISFTMFATAEFKLVTQADGQRATKAGVRYYDPTPESIENYYVGESYAYKVAPLLVDLDATTVSRGTVNDLTYTLSQGAPDSFFVQASSGVIFGQFESAGTYEFSLLAVDKGGKIAEVEKYKFTAIDRDAFRIVRFQHAVDASADYTNIETPNLILAVGSTYRMAPLKIIAAENAYDELSALEFSLKDAPKGFLLDPTDGFIQGTPAVEGEHTMQLYAVNSLNDLAFVENISFSIKPKDADVPEFGPNGQRCEHGATVDAIPFDEVFTCNCNSTLYEGPNCAVPIILTSNVEVTTKQAGGAVASGLLGGMAALLVIGILVHKHKKRKYKMRAHDFQAQVDRMVEMGELEMDSDDASRDRRGHSVGIPRELKRAHLTLIKIIGEGAFGEVWKGVLDESSIGGVPGYMVAVKTSKEAKGEGADEILREATIMAQMVPHKNVVSLIGVVTSGRPLMLVVSMCEHGSLLSMLRDRKLKVQGFAPYTFAERLKMAVETATGMAHLIDNKFIHRDLAARNVLVDSDMSCKIADFGLARGIHLSSKPDQESGGGGDGSEQEYYRSSRGTFPVRWTAPEAMQTLRFSEKSDVWSFGITMIEIFADGNKPYTQLDNQAVISKVQAGYRAPKPEHATDAVYVIMLKCWEAKPASRPTFKMLVETLKQVKGGTFLSPNVKRPARKSQVGNGGLTTGLDDDDLDSAYLDVADREQASVDAYDNSDAGVPTNDVEIGNDTYFGEDRLGAGGTASNPRVSLMTGFDATASDGGDEYLTVGNEASNPRVSLMTGFDATGSDGGDEYLTVGNESEGEGAADGSDEYLMLGGGRGSLVTGFDVDDNDVSGTENSKVLDAADAEFLSLSQSLLDVQINRDLTGELDVTEGDDDNYLMNIDL